MKTLKTQDKGFALTLTLIFMALVIALIAVFILSVGSGVTQANSLTNQKMAYYMADAGLADAYERIVQSGLTTYATSGCGLGNPNIPSTCTCPFIPSPTALCPTPANPNTDNGVYTLSNGFKGSYAVTVQASGSPLIKYVITSQGTYGKTSKILQLTIQAASISRFAYWSQTEINPTLGTLWWISGMVTTGPTQTNGQLNLIGNPVFNGAVAEGNYTQNAQGVWGVTTNTPDYKNGTGNNPNSTTVSDPNFIFPDGITNQAPTVTLPPPATLSDFQTAANSSGLTLTGAATILFNGSTITVTGKVINSNCQTVSNYNSTSLNIPAGGETIYVQSTKTIAKCNSNSADGNATVQDAPNQTLNGQLTIAADQNVYVAGNIKYNSSAASSTNVLGLVASNNITVTEATAPAQLTVDAVLMALQGSFNVDQYSKDPDPVSGGLDGANMTQFGALINYASGCTGVVNGSGQLVDGWNQIQQYDTRLGTLAPPGFPPMVNSLGNAVYNKISITECSNLGVCG